MPRSKRSIQYAVVGLGHIAQVAVLPAFAHARSNSKLAALVTDDPRKQRKVAEAIQADQPSATKTSTTARAVDAVYIALPNAMHPEYTIRAAAPASTCSAKSRWR